MGHRAIWLAAVLMGMVGTAPLLKAQEPAPILLTVDVSDPSNVVITSTGEAPAVSDSGTYTFGDGVTLENLFTFNANTFGPLGSATLTTGVDSNGTYFNFFGYDNLSTGRGTNTALDLNLFNSSSNNLMMFDTGVAAFSGSTTVDLGGLALASPGYIGPVVEGYSNSSSNTLIGLYQVVPEPSIAALCLIGGSAVLALRQRTRRAR